MQKRLIEEYLLLNGFDKSDFTKEYKNIVLKLIIFSPVRSNSQENI